MMEKHPCFVRITKPVRNRLRSYSHFTGQSMGQAATEILARHLTRHEKANGKKANPPRPKKEEQPE